MAWYSYIECNFFKFISVSMFLFNIVHSVRSRIICNEGLLYSIPVLKLFRMVSVITGSRHKDLITHRISSCYRKKI